MVKRALILLCGIVGGLFLLELIMPGHLERLGDYLEGNWTALTSWVTTE